MSAAEKPGGDRSTRLALAAVGVVVLLVLGTILLESLRSPDRSEPNPSSRSEVVQSPTAPMPEGAGTSDPEAPTSTTSSPLPGDVASWRALLKQDPTRAAIALGQMEAGADRDSRLEELMLAWTNTEPGIAGDWLLAQPRGEFSIDAAAEFSRAWAERDPASAALWIGNNIEHPSAESAIGGLLSKWVNADSDAARDWVESIEHPSALSTASSALAYTWSQNDPSGASRWVAEMNDPSLRARAAVNLVNAWSATDPAAAAAWLSANLTDPLQRDAAALPLILTWADTDPHAASVWVARLPGGELQEKSKSIFAESLAAEAPEDAITWARSINSPEDRNESILNIYEDWMDADKPALLSHLRTNLNANADPALREEIYDMLFENDPAFREELIRLYEEREP